jgi:hypothetical protein
MLSTMSNSMTDEEMEIAIAAKLVTDALALNYTVSVYDSEEWCLKRSSNQEVIMKALNSTGWDQLRFRDSKGEYVGTVALIWGNSSWELISDYTVSEAMETLVKGANELADQFSEQYQG